MTVWTGNSSLWAPSRNLWTTTWGCSTQRFGLWRTSVARSQGPPVASEALEFRVHNRLPPSPFLRPSDSATALIWSNISSFDRSLERSNGPSRPRNRISMVWRVRTGASGPKPPEARDDSPKEA